MYHMQTRGTLEEGNAPATPEEAGNDRSAALPLKKDGPHRWRMMGQETPELTQLTPEEPPADTWMLRGKPIKLLVGMVPLTLFRTPAQ